MNFNDWVESLPSVIKLILYGKWRRIGWLYLQQK